MKASATLKTKESQQPLAGSLPAVILAAKLALRRQSSISTSRLRFV
jgi:hypothetical protein